MDARLRQLQLYRQGVDGRCARRRLLIGLWALRAGTRLCAVSAVASLLFALYAHLDYEVNLFSPRVTDFHRSRFG